MSEGLYRWIPLVEHRGRSGGTLIMLQPGPRTDAIPFQIRKVLYITDLQPGHVRGGHAHLGTEEVLVCLRGACTVELDNGRGQTAVVRLDRRDRGLYLPPRVWRVVHDFEPATDLLALASMEYDESDYIRSREAFETMAATAHEPCRPVLVERRV